MDNKNKITIIAALGIGFAIGFGRSANALTFNLSYDTSVTNDPNAASIEQATQLVANEYSSLFSNNVTLNIDVIGKSLGSSGSIGTSSSSGYTSATYNRISTAIKNNSPNINFSSLPSTDPGISTTYYVPNAQAKALGLSPQNAFISSSNPSDTKQYDGLFTFNTDYSYSYNSTAIAGKFDFVSLAEHEISEIMGRVDGVTSTNGTYYATPYDLFSFTAPGVRDSHSSNNNAGDYFSLDNGVTNLQSYAAGTGGDWITIDPFGYGQMGTAEPLVSQLPTDISTMNSLGWTSSPTSIPEPLTVFGTLIGGAAAAIFKKRLRK